jgi:hypothetical protein
MSSTGPPCKYRYGSQRKLSTAKRGQGIFGQRSAVEAVGGGNAEKSFEQFAHDALRQIAGDEYQSRPVVVVWPAIEARGRVEYVLNTVDDDR